MTDYKNERRLVIEHGKKCPEKAGYHYRVFTHHQDDCEPDIVLVRPFLGDTTYLKWKAYVVGYGMSYGIPNPKDASGKTARYLPVEDYHNKWDLWQVKMAGEELMKWAAKADDRSRHPGDIPKPPKIRVRWMLSGSREMRSGEKLPSEFHFRRRAEIAFPDKPKPWKVGSMARLLNGQILEVRDMWYSRGNGKLVLKFKLWEKALLAYAIDCENVTVASGDEVGPVPGDVTSKEFLPFSSWYDGVSRQLQSDKENKFWNEIADRMRVERMKAQVRKLYVPPPGRTYWTSNFGLMDEAVLKSMFAKYSMTDDPAIRINALDEPKKQGKSPRVKSVKWVETQGWQVGSIAKLPNGLILPVKGMWFAEQSGRLVLQFFPDGVEWTKEHGRGNDVLVHANECENMTAKEKVSKELEERIVKEYVAGAQAAMSNAFEQGIFPSVKVTPAWRVGSWAKDKKGVVLVVADARISTWSGDLYLSLFGDGGKTVYTHHSNYENVTPQIMES